LVELDTAIEARAILWMSVVALTGALKDCLGVLSDALDPTLTVHDADNPEGGNMEALCRSHGDKVLGSREQILL
jgi:hypothetical protein